MLKFRCQSCGQRIAVPSRHLGKLVTCSECGAQTHPLAEQIVGASSSRAGSAAGPAVGAQASASPQAACDNCGSAIGRLQSVHSWNGHSVCGACYPRLVGDSSAHVAVPAVARVVAEAPAAPAALVTRTRAEAAAEFNSPAIAAKPLVLELRERVLRALVVFLVASVALYGALTLLRDIAGLVAVAAVAVLALLALYALFRGTLAARRRMAGGAAAIVPHRPA
jgi:predicted RNA-binding Zn-ribbon protein involved in translation (DUF1610 family)